MITEGDEEKIQREERGLQRERLTTGQNIEERETWKNTKPANKTRTTLIIVKAGCPANIKRERKSKTTEKNNTTDNRIRIVNT